MAIESADVPARELTRPVRARFPQPRFRFVELGRGRVDLPAAFKALHQAKFRGWAIVELDSVPDPKRSPKESALISKNYVHEKLGLAI